MSTFSTCTSSTRPSSPTDGDVLFETDTKNIIIWDGTNWRIYFSDGLPIGGSSYSLLLDGTDDRVELNSDISFLNSSSAFSISAWLKLSSSASLAYFYQSGSDTFYNSISFYQSTSMDFLIGKGGSSYAGTRYSGNIKDDTWHHLAGVYDGSSLTIYLDGTAPTQSAIGTAVPSSTVSTGGQSPHIGSKTDDSSEFTGSMDDFAIFDDALTATEVSNIYNNAVYPSAKLKHLYKFENNFNDSIGSINGTAQSNAQTDSSTTRP